MRNLPARLGVAIAALLCLYPAMSGATSFDTSTFQKPDGAIVVGAGDNNYVDPYFATKALLVAEDGGLDIRKAALSWIRWALPRQRADGLFRRFCSVNGEWRDCAPADADDSMLALWMQLLYRVAPSVDMIADWQRSVSLTSRQLQRLRNSRLGVYHVSRQNHVALLMDNIEVYTALKEVAEEQERLHDPTAVATRAEAEQLKTAIIRIFWDGHAQRFRASMQKTPRAFYPDVVAQIYPWLAGESGPGQDPRRAWEKWKETFGAGWIERSYDPEPWGLVALAAFKLGDTASAACWTAQSNAVRGSSNWNVLEEAVWQALRANFSQSQVLDPRACSGILNQSSARLAHR